MTRGNSKTEVVYCSYTCKFFREVLYVDHSHTLTTTMKQCRRPLKHLLKQRSLALLVAAEPARVAKDIATNTVGVLRRHINQNPISGIGFINHIRMQPARLGCMMMWVALPKKFDEMSVIAWTSFGKNSA